MRQRPNAHMRHGNSTLRVNSTPPRPQQASRQQPAQRQQHAPKQQQPDRETDDLNRLPAFLMRPVILPPKPEAPAPRTRKKTNVEA